MSVLITRPVPDAAVERLGAVTMVEVLAEDVARDRAALLRAVSGRRALLSTITERIDGELLDAAAGVEIVANMAAGYDNIDVSAASARGIYVTNTPGVLTETTADLTFALLLAAARRLTEGERLLRAGGFDRWGPLMLLGQEVGGRTLGIAGMGRIGRAVARRARGFEMEILYYGRRHQPDAERELGARRVDKEELLARSDFLVLLLPLSAETRHFIGARELSAMPSHAVLVNVSRGPVVDEAALVEALASGTIWSAGLDVYEREPEVHPGLLELDNIVLLPHIGSASYASRGGMAELAADNILDQLRGETPRSAVNGPFG